LAYPALSILKPFFTLAIDVKRLKHFQPESSVHDLPADLFLLLAVWPQEFPTRMIHQKATNNRDP